MLMFYTKFKTRTSKHQNINFTVEQESIGSLSFLDVNICRKNGKFVTAVSRTLKFGGVFTNYKSLIPTYQKRGLLHSLLHRKTKEILKLNFI